MRSTTTRDRNLQFRGAVSTGGSPLIFCFFSSFYVQVTKTSPLKSGESSEKSSGENRVKACHVCGCHGFFGPDILELLISVLITLTLTLKLLIVFGVSFKSVIGNCFGDQIPGCVKEIGISPPLRLDVPPFGITLTLWKLHLHF